MKRKVIWTITPSCILQSLRISCVVVIYWCECFNFLFSCSDLNTSTDNFPRYFCTRSRFMRYEQIFFLFLRNQVRLACGRVEEEICKCITNIYCAHVWSLSSSFVHLFLYMKFISGFECKLLPRKENQCMNQTSFLAPFNTSSLVPSPAA